MTQSASASASADQHLVEYDVERRVQLTFAVSPEQAKKLLPASWQVASMPPGPSEGANFMVAFRNRLLTVHYNADGEARVGEQDRGAILLVFAKNTENGEFAFRVVRSFSANAHAIPGPYKNAQFATVDMEQGMTAQETSDSSGFERWQIRPTRRRISSRAHQTKWTVSTSFSSIAQLRSSQISSTGHKG